jgi:hypothetical protein
VDEAIHLYRLGWSLARVGEHLDVDPATVRNRLQERGSAFATHTGGLVLTYWWIASSSQPQPTADTQPKLCFPSTE